MQKVNRIIRLCHICGKGVSRKESEESLLIFCSRACHTLHRTSSPLNNSNYKGGKESPCKHCGTPKYRTPYQLKKEFLCSMRCRSIWTSKNLIGTKANNFKDAIRLFECCLCLAVFTSYSKNRKFCTVECKKSAAKLPKVKQVCTQCGITYKVYPSASKWSSLRGVRNRYCSKTCSTEGRSGQQNPRWIADRSKLKNRHKSTRESARMKRWRSSVFLRDDFTCQMCFARSSKGQSVVLNAHHIRKFSLFPHLAFDITNGITLCYSCHLLTYSKEEEFIPLFSGITEVVP